MIYRKLPKLSLEDVQYYEKIDDNGICYLTCSEDNEEFIQWIADGGTVIDNGGKE